jgi:hypothetical protein
VHGWRHAHAVTRSSCMSRSAPRSVSQHVVYVAEKRRSTRYVTWRGDTWRCVPRSYLCIHINSKDKDRKGCDVWQRQNPSLEFPFTICSRSPRRRARRRRPARRKATLALSFFPKLVLQGLVMAVGMTSVVCPAAPMLG